MMVTSRVRFWKYMSKIKYQNLGIKNRLKKYFKGDEIYNFEELIERLARKYNITKPIIKDMDLEFDYLNIILGSSEYAIKTYIVAFDYFNSNLIIARRIDKKRYDILEVFDNTPFIIKSGYENLKDNIKIEKLYTKRENESYSYSINGIDFIEYMYYYINQDMECKIKLKFIKSILFQDNLFMKGIFEANDIKTIDDLYKKIISLTSNNQLDIEIENIKNKEFPETIIVKKGKLIEYKKNIVRNGELEYLDYHDDMLYITKKEDPNSNQHLNNFKKTLYKK